MLSPEQVKSIKEQIIKQIGSWNASYNQKTQAKSYLESLNSEQLEDFLKQNKMIKSEETKTQTSPPKKSQEQENKPLSQKTKQEQAQCPFCLITQGKIPSFKLDENKTSIAVLEINPLSRGHAIIIPKKHSDIEKIPSQSFTLAKKISGKIKTKLKPEKISIQTEEILGHGLINIIPVYADEKLEKKKATEEELKEIQEKLKSKPKEKKERIKKTVKIKELEKAPRRIP